MLWASVASLQCMHRFAATWVVTTCVCLCCLCCLCTRSVRFEPFLFFFRKEVQGPYEKAAALADEVLFAIRTVVPWSDACDVFSRLPSPRGVFLLNLRSRLVERRRGRNEFQIPSIKGGNGKGLEKVNSHFLPSFEVSRFLYTWHAWHVFSEPLE